MTVKVYLRRPEIDGQAVTEISCGYATYDVKDGIVKCSEAEAALLISSAPGLFASVPRELASQPEFNWPKALTEVATDQASVPDDK